MSIHFSSFFYSSFFDSVFIWMVVQAILYMDKFHFMCCLKMTAVTQLASPTMYYFSTITIICEVIAGYIECVYVIGPQHVVWDHEIISLRPLLQKKNRNVRAYSNGNVDEMEEGVRSSWDRTDMVRNTIKT